VGFDESLKAIAEGAGEHPVESFIHISSQVDGKAFFTLGHFNQDMDALAKALSSEFCLPALGDAGTFEPGKKADLNIIKLEVLSERMPELVHDFPGEAPRFIQKAWEYRATICNGEVILENDHHIGARPGSVLRHVTAS
jgi:N-acyl-D-aspartate/D-glutamate deacylase